MSRKAPRKYESLANQAISLTSNPRDVGTLPPGTPEEIAAFIAQLRTGPRPSAQRTLAQPVSPASVPLTESSIITGEFGKYVWQARRARKWNRARLAAMASTSVRVIRDLETGKAGTALLTVVLVLTALNIHIKLQAEPQYP